MTALAVNPTPDSCKCGTAIIWARTTTGRAMPVDADPSPDGNVILERAGAAVLAFVFSTSAAATAARPGERHHQSHFVTCPDAASFRNPKGARRVHGG